MFSIIWEYQVRPENEAEFEQVYSSNGSWADLFRKSDGYIGTELLRDEKHSRRYLTIDRWISQAAYAAFKSQWKAEYEALDAECEGLTEHESMLGRWNSREIKHIK